MWVIFACANGLRTIATCSIPVSWMLSVHRVRPVISRWSSLRRRRVADLSLRLRPVLGDGHDGAPLEGVGDDLLAGGGLHRPDDVVVAGAPAQVALEPAADLVLGRLRVVVEQVDRLHDHARRAVAALEGVTLVEGGLHRVQLAVLGEPLDGGDLLAVRLDREHVAGLHAAAAQVHGAGAAVAGVAADHGPGLAEPFAQVVDEKRARFDVVGVLRSVDGDTDPGHRHISWLDITAGQRCSEPIVAALTKGDKGHGGQNRRPIR